MRNVESIRLVRLRKGEAKCVICKGRFHDGQVAVLDCGETFHFSCYGKWTDEGCSKFTAESVKAG